MSIHGPLLAIAAFTLLNVWEGAIKGCTQAIEKDGEGAIKKLSVSKPADISFSPRQASEDLRKAAATAGHDLESGNIEAVHREGFAHQLRDEAVRRGIEDLIKHPNGDDKRDDKRTR